ncbi:carbon-nitrogen hydrolase family protein [Streptomyces sp. HNM0575]|uniref:carbon-nitrogen hydrolase family protein n=1 Tax=Streptomyces sp. HNM0575 TaxID=2716338 RepID=UPI00145C4138|nr:carbon-nitrogen hydrolase family protein [Streptomyces sp. HNM0575]NLU74209.1 carbon-nitrogen hydrolase family protein [Streptomyces sp. HNM0575]
MAQLTVATCQFPVDARIDSNCRHVTRQLRHAKEQGADIAHFPEAALSGYAGVDFADHRGFDWELLESCTRRVMELAAELRLWVVLGSAHPLTGDHKPHNSLYVIDDSGSLVDRYDKRFCSGDPEARTGDLAHYTPGDHPVVFTVGGVRCATLICYDFRFPELYREYKRQGVQLVLHSFHAGHMSPAKLAAIREAIGEDVLRLNTGDTYPGITMPATMTAEAAANHVWISCPNSSARESCWGAFFVRADGVTTGRLPRNRSGVLISTVDTEAPLYDSTRHWRARAMDGVLNSGTTVRDPRSEQRTRL